MPTSEKRFQDSGQDARDYFEMLARQRIEEGDIFTHPVVVIPVKTQGRTYGSLSQEAVRRGAVIPQLSLTQSRKVGPYIFVALWNDNNAYTPNTLFDCGASIAMCASREGVEMVAVPLLGGNEARKWLWAVERGFQEAFDTLDAAGFPIPWHTNVTDKKVA